jgi:hypothetical protein
MPHAPPVASDNTPDPLAATRAAGRLIACSRGLAQALNAIVVTAGGALFCVATLDEPRWGIAIGVWSMVMGGASILAPLAVSRLRARSGMRVMARGDDVRASGPARSGLVIGFIVGVGLIGLAFAFGSRVSLPIETIVAAALAILALGPLVRFIRLRLWEDLFLACMFVAAAAAMHAVDGWPRSGGAAMILIGVSAVICGVSFEWRWRRWMASAAGSSGAP